MSQQFDSHKELVEMYRKLEESRAVIEKLENLCGKAISLIPNLDWREQFEKELEECKKKSGN